MLRVAHLRAPHQQPGNTFTADEQTELMAEVSRLKRTLAEAKMQVVNGRHGKFRIQPTRRRR